jgi:cytochrome c biogenesis protein
MRKRRYRVRRVGDVVCAERGYTRELGNLSFHVALLGVLLAIGYGSLLGHSGSAIVVEGQGFSNTLTQYDDISTGAAFNGQLDPFTVKLDAFHVAYETGPVQTGAAREFKADVTVTEPSGTRTDTIEVNKPLTVGSTNVHLVGHGYAAVVTVRDGNGNVAYSGPVVFQPLDSNLKSAGRDQRAGRAAAADRARRVLPADRVCGPRGTGLAVPRGAQPGAVPDRVGGAPEDGDGYALERVQP